MAKNRGRRRGIVARWLRRLWWLRKVVVLGAVLGGVAKAAQSRRGGGTGGVGGIGGTGGPGGSGRPSPIGGPSSPSRAASATVPTPEPAEAYTAPAGSVRTLVSVPPLPAGNDTKGIDDVEADHAEGPADTAGDTETDATWFDATWTDATTSDATVSDATVSDVTGADAPRSGASEADARPGSADRAWVEPLDGKQCPPGYPVKANDNSGIYHVPGGRFYQRTVAERCYATPAAAEADGYRAAKA